MKKVVSPIVMFFFGVLAFAVIMIVTKKLEFDDFEDPNFWFYRVLTALAASAISISIPGMLGLNHDPLGNATEMSLLEKEPTISASGAIAIFVLVYLFNPLV